MFFLKTWKPHNNSNDNHLNYLLPLFFIYFITFIWLFVCLFVFGSNWSNKPLSLSQISQMISVHTWLELFVWRKSLPVQESNVNVLCQALVKEHGDPSFFYSNFKSNNRSLCKEWVYTNLHDRKIDHHWKSKLTRYKFIFRSRYCKELWGTISIDHCKLFALFHISKHQISVTTMISPSC